MALRTKISIGLMPGGLDGLFLTQKTGHAVFFLLPAGKEEAVWAQQFLPKRQCVFYDVHSPSLSMADLDLEGVAKHSNLEAVLKKHRITHLLVHHGVGSYLSSWAQKNKITLIAPDRVLASSLENKIWFDTFLTKYQLPKPASQIIQPNSDTIHLPGRLVLQEATSRGAEGTYFLKNKKEVKKLLATKKITPTKKYLLRQFVNGQALGITIFIANQQTVLSAARRQCYGALMATGQKSFYGIQWVPSTQFSKKIKKIITDVFSRLGSALITHGFVGYANIDFMLNQKGEIFIIECNPRIAASTTQLLAFPETIGGIKTAAPYVHTMLSGKITLSHRNTFFPPSTFSGATLYIQAPKNEKKFLIQKNYSAGVYTLKNNKIRFITPDVTAIQNRDGQFIFYPDVEIGDRVDADTIIASMLTSFPLYDVHGMVNTQAKLLLNHFSYVD